MRYRDIPQAINSGSWQCGFSIKAFCEAIKKWEKDGLEMNPDFQRGYVWNKSQQISYIEALLENRCKNANTIYLNNSTWVLGGNKNFYCVDGLQRYMSVKNFYENKLKVYGDFLLDDFEDKKMLLRTFLLKINMNMLKTKKEVLEWYIQLNTGGTVHTEEEIGRVKKMMEKL